jgi:hypothetical protein
LDYFAWETTWVLIEKSPAGEDQILLTGPDFAPNSYETLETIFEMKPGRDYVFTLKDSYGDGFDGTFAIYGIGQDGKETLLVTGPDRNFSLSHIVAFSAPDKTAPEPSCSDSMEDVFLERELFGSCAALASDWTFFGYLCGFADVALACPVTCGTCEDQKTVTEDTCDADTPGTVDMGDLLGERDCEWLGMSFVESNRYESACLRTNVAFHCSVTCNTCENLSRAIH